MSSVTRRLIGRAILFDFQQYSSFTFSDATKITIDARLNLLRLKKDSKGFYPTGPDIFARTPLVNPTAVRKWIGIDSEITEPVTDGVKVGFVRYRLNDGTSDRYWNGTTWAIAGAGNWNTLALVQDNIAVFPVTSKQIRLTFNLETTDKRKTPVVRRATLLFEADVPSFDEEFIYRVLVKQLKTTRPETDIAILWPGGNTYDLDSTTLEETPGNGIDLVVSAFNYTDDPTLGTDLLSSYDPNTHVIVLTQSVSAGKNVLLRATYKPVVAFTTHPDFNEIAKVPAILIDSVDEALQDEDPRQEFIVNRTNNAAILAPCPRQAMYRVGLSFVTARASELWRLGEAVETLFRRNPVLSSLALDLKLSASVIEPFRTSPRTDETHEHMGSMTMSLKSAEKWIFPQGAGFGVKRVVFTGDLPVTVT